MSLIERLFNREPESESGSASPETQPGSEPDTVIENGKEVLDRLPDRRRDRVIEGYEKIIKPSTVVKKGKNIKNINKAIGR